MKPDPRVNISSQIFTEYSLRWKLELARKALEEMLQVTEEDIYARPFIRAKARREAERILELTK